MSPRRHLHLPATAIIVVVALGACSSGLERPALPQPGDEATFSIELAPPDNSDKRIAWWQRALADDLANAVERALAANAELRRLQAERDAARARLDQARANRGLTVDGFANASIEDQSGDGSDRQAVGIDADLPIDINGALGDRVRAAQRELTAAEADLVQNRSDLALDFALAAIDDAEATQRLILLNKQIDIAQELLRLIELRFTQGLTSSVDVLQQRDQLAGLRQDIPVANRDRRLAGNALRRVASTTPDQELPYTDDDLPTIVSTFPPLQPVDLLDERADLRAQRARLEAADARFAAALADRWPTLSLSGSAIARTVSGDFERIVSAAIAAALTLFDSGSKHAIAAERRADLVAAGERYLRDWIEIVLGIDDLLHEEASLRQRIELSLQRLQTAKALLDATQRRYRRGVSDYLPVLEALRSLQQQQRDHLALQAELARTRLRLHHALGSPQPQEPT